MTPKVLSVEKQAVDLQNAYDTVLHSIKQLDELQTFIGLVGRAETAEERRVGLDRLAQALNDLGEYLYQGACGDLAAYVDTSADQPEA